MIRRRRSSRRECRMTRAPSSTASTRAWAAPAVDRFVALLHPDVRLLQPVTKPMVGREAARREFARLLRFLPDMRGTHRSQRRRRRRRADRLAVGVRARRQAVRAAHRRPYRGCRWVDQGTRSLLRLAALSARPARPAAILARVLALSRLSAVGAHPGAPGLRTPPFGFAQGSRYLAGSPCRRSPRPFSPPSWSAPSR